MDTMTAPAASLESVKRKIRGLLNLGGDAAATEAEAASAMAMARRMLLQHQLSENDLGASPEEVARRENYGQIPVHTLGKSITEWEASLAHAVSAFVFGSIGVYRKRTPGNDAILFYGPIRDVQDAVPLYEEWSRMIDQLARRAVGGSLRGPGRSWARGFVSGLLERLKSERAQETAAPSTARTSVELVLVQRTLTVSAAKLAEAKHWLAREANVQLGKAVRTHVNHYGDAYSAGRQAGREANLSRSATRRLN